MNDPITTLRDNILLTMLPHVASEGWTWAGVKHAAAMCKIQDDIQQSLFPNGLSDVVAHFSDWADRHMAEKLESLPSTGLRSKDKVRIAVTTRYSVLENNKDAVRASIAYWAAPSRVIQGQRVLWRTADAIWNWAGDTATDYNRQTKRALLASIMVGTTMVWIGDESDNHVLTHAFLDRRLENVMEFGKAIGTMKKIVPNLFRQANFRK